MHSLLIAASASLVFMDLEVVRVAGKSIVLPYLATFVLGASLLAHPSRLRYALKDPALPFLLAWVLVACFCSALGYLRYQREPFLRYERNDLLAHDATQILNLLMMLAQYVIFVCALRGVSPRQLRQVVVVFVSVGVVGAVYALYQMGFVLFGWPYRELFRTSNLYLRAESLEPGGFGGWIRVPRAFGTAPEPSLWGAYLAVVLSFLLGALNVGRWRWAGLPTWAGITVVAFAIVATFSRGTWAAVAIVLLFWVVSRYWRRVPGWSMAGLLLVTVLATLWPAAIIRGSTRVFEDLSALERMSAHLTGLRILFENPLFGIGFGSIEFFIDHYAVLLPGYDEIRFITVFSFFLLVFVSTGIVGAVLFWAFLTRLAATLTRSFRLSVEDPSLQALRLGATLSCVAVLASWLNQPGYNFSYIWFCLALGSTLTSVLDASTPIAHRADRGMM